MDLKNFFLNKPKRLLYFLILIILPVFLSYGSSVNFEAGLGNWAQSIEDDFDWNIGPTQWSHSEGTGPNNAAEGVNYLYIEASLPNNPNKIAILENTLNLDSADDYFLTFQYNMYGSDIGSLYLEIYDDAWIPIVFLNGEQTQESTWRTALVNLSTYKGVSALPIRFRAITGEGFQGDISIDDVILSPGVDSDSDGMADVYEQFIANYSTSDSMSSISDVNPFDDFDQDSLNNITEFLLHKNPTSALDNDVTVEDGITILSKISEMHQNKSYLGVVNLDDYFTDIIYNRLEESASSIFSSIYESDISYTSISNAVYPLNNFISVEALFYDALCSLYGIIDINTDAIAEFASYSDGIIYNEDLYYKGYLPLSSNTNYSEDYVGKHTQYYDYLRTTSLSDKVREAAYSNAIPEINLAINMLDLAGYNINLFGSNIVLSSSVFPLDSSVHIDQADLKFFKGGLSLIKSSLHHICALKLEADIDQLIQPSPTAIRTITVDGSEADWGNIEPAIVGSSEIALDNNRAEDDYLSYVKYAVDANRLYFLVKTQDSLTDISFYHKGSNINSLSNLYISVNNYDGNYTAEYYSSESDFEYGGNSLLMGISTNGLIREGWVDLTGISESFLNTNFAFSYLSLNNSINNFNGEYVTISDIFVGYIYNTWGFEILNDGIGGIYSNPNDYLFSGHTFLRDFVTNELTLAKSSLTNAIDSILTGYSLASTRPGTSNMHMVELDGADFVAGSNGEALIDQMNLVQSSLKEPITISPENEIYIKVSNNFIGDYDANGWLSERVHLGALYEPNYLTLDSILPQFYNSIYEPLVDTLPVPTFGGLLPDVTQERLDIGIQLGIESEELSIDIDNDGLPDSYEISRFSHPSGAQPFVDYDDDGQSTISEYYMGTHPFNPVSKYTINISSNGSTAALSMSKANHFIYDVQWCSVVGDVPVNVVSDISTSSILDLPYNHGFYRVCIKDKQPNDVDGDLIVNRIESAIGGNKWSTINDHLLLDNDLDGINNITEAIYKTNPSDSNSYFWSEFNANGTALSWFLGEVSNDFNDDPFDGTINQYNPLTQSFSNVYDRADYNDGDVIPNALQISAAQEYGLYQISPSPLEEASYLFMSDWTEVE